MKDLRRVAVLLIMIAITVAAGAANGPSKRVLNVQALYNYLVYPNIQQAFPASGVSPVDALFSGQTQGRIAPLGEGHDLATVKKYFFGLSPINNTNATYTVTAVTFRSITDQPPFVLVEVDVSFTPTSIGLQLGVQPYQVRETGQFTFDKAFHIVSFDLLIPYFDSAMAIAGSDFSDPNVVSESIAATCNVAQQTCTAASTGYAGVSDCESFLSSLPTGTWNRGVNQNTAVCRAFHTQLLSIDPARECPVLGRTGGGQCTDSNTYSNYFSETF